jgi:hypothetical protein
LKTRIRKPRDFHMPESKALVARCDSTNDGDKFIQLSSAGTVEPKTARRLAGWLLRAEKWLAKP